MFQLCHKCFAGRIAQLHGVIYGVGVKRIPPVKYASWGVLLCWMLHNRRDYGFSTVPLNAPQVIRGDFHHVGFVLARDDGSWMVIIFLGPLLEMWCSSM